MKFKKDYYMFAQWVSPIGVVFFWVHRFIKRIWWKRKGAVWSRASSSWSSFGCQRRDGWWLLGVWRIRDQWVIGRRYRNHIALCLHGRQPYKTWWMTWLMKEKVRLKTASLSAIILYKEEYLLYRGGWDGGNLQ